MSYKYLLTITGSLDIWRKDIQLLILLDQFLKEEENVEYKKRTYIARIKKFYADLEISDTLRRHFSSFIAQHDIEKIKIDELLEKISMLEDKDAQEEQYISEYLKNRREMMPFLFS